tara:strand:- start:648 stop:3587 length:2940 start_codon:yes stop_codon:yes gene_type:complete
MLETSREISKRLKIFVRTMFVTCVLMLNPSLVAEDFYSDISVEGKQSIQHESEFNSHEPINGFGLPTDRPDYVGGLYDSRLDYLSFSSDELEDLLQKSLDTDDYKAPIQLDIDSSRAWNKLVQELPKLIEEIKAISSISEKGPDKLLGIDLEGIHAQNPRLSVLEQASSIASFELINSYKNLRQRIDDNESSLEAIEDFRNIIAETKETMSVHLQNIIDMGSEGAQSRDLEFSEVMNKVLFSQSVHETITLDKEIGELENKEISVFSNNPKILINLNTFDTIEAPSPNASIKKINRYRKKLGDTKALKAYKSGSRYQKLRPRKYYIRGAVKDSAGNTVGLAVATNKRTSQAFIVPVATKEKRSYKAVTQVAKMTSTAQKVSSFVAFQGLLKSVKILTIQRPKPITNFESQYTEFSLDESIKLRDACFRFHQDSIANQALLLGQKFENLRSLYMELDQIQNFLLKIGTQFQMEYKSAAGKDSKDGSSDGKANQLFYIGSSQNLLAAVVSLICQKYQFDSSGRLVDGQTIKDEYKLNNVVVTEYAVVRQSRLGNFYSVGTNNADEVMAYDHIHRGQYSMNLFVFTGPGEAKVSIQFTGLNYSRNNSNTYKAFILNPQHPKFKELKSELSKMTPNQESVGETVHFKLPLNDTETFKNHPDIVLASKEIKSSPTKDDFVINFSGKISEGQLYAVYQEASGLRDTNRNQWVDYDEVLTHVFAWNSRSFEPVDKDSFRIIIDGSGTMKKLFKPTVTALHSEFEKLGMQDFLSTKSNLKPLYYFGENKASKSPYKLATLKGEVQAGGHSPINLAVKQLVCPGSSAQCSTKNIPDKPWTLLIISDFDSRDPHFDEQNWATGLVHESNRRPSDRRVPVRSMMIKDTEDNYRVRSSAGGKHWKSLQAIHLIGVGPFLGTIKTGNSSRELTAKDWLQNNESLKQGSFGVKFSQISENDTDSLAKSIESFLKPISESMKMYESHKQELADW